MSWAILAPVAYDEDIADRVRALVGGDGAEKRMFGGLAFLVNGNMAVAASGRGGLMVRVVPEDSDDLVADPRAERMVMRGREMDGWLRVDVDGMDDAAFATWVDRGVSRARSLPPK